MAETGCRFFNGYKPCAKSTACNREHCDSYSPVRSRVLLIHLEALGAVLRSTALLKAIRKKFEGCHLTWVTRAPADQLLQGLSDVDRIISLNIDGLLALSALEFDVALVVDKSLVASGILERTRVLGPIFGFKASPITGASLPATRGAIELWELGLNNHLKFFVNQKSEQQLTHEALALGHYRRDPYQVGLSSEELKLAKVRRQQWSPDSAPIIGINTGCAANLPAKKLSISAHRALITMLMQDPRTQGYSIVLLGGKEDTDRNDQIARDLPVFQSPTTKGLRDGLASVAACDIVISGDSLGMHMAIALQKWVVAWFGPTCEQEIDLYDRGVKVITKATCSPCWKRVCDEPVMCYDQVDLNQIVDGVAKGIEWLILFSKQHSPGTCSSQSLS